MKFTSPLAHGKSVCVQNTYQGSVSYPVKTHTHTFFACINIFGGCTPEKDM